MRLMVAVPAALKEACFVAVHLPLLLAGTAEGRETFKRETAYLCMPNGEPATFNVDTQQLQPLPAQENPRYVKIIAKGRSRGLRWSQLKLAVPWNITFCAPWLLLCLKSCSGTGLVSAQIQIHTDQSEL